MNISINIMNHHIFTLFNQFIPSGINLKTNIIPAADDNFIKDISNHLIFFIFLLNFFIIFYSLLYYFLYKINILII